MARIDTFGHFLTDVATAIRNKTGKSETIACEDFDTEIESISGGGGQKNRLPDEYQEVEYIQSSGTQYFITDYYANGNSCYDFQFSDGITSGVIFGAYNTGWTTGSGFYHNNTTSQREYFHYYANTMTALDGSYTKQFTLSSEKGVLYSNGAVISSVSDKTFTLSYPLYILAGNWYGSRAEQPISCKLYYFKIHEGGTNIHEFIPCYRKLDNVIGMYDLVEDEFITNAGTGTFEKGPNHDTPIANLQDKEITITENTTTEITADSDYDGLGTVSVVTNVSGSSGRLPSEYQEVEYIGIISGNGYIDTGFKPTYNTTVEARATVTNGWLCGEDTSWQNSGFGILKNYSYFSNKYTSIAVNNDIHNFVTSKDGYYVDETLKDSFSGASTFTATNNLYIYANNRNGNVTEYGKGNLYTFKIYESNVLVHDLVPCYKKSDYTIGLYDLIDTEFLSPTGSGTWTKGDNVTGLNLQTKDVTINTNTTTAINYDDSFDGLKKVNVTTNVQPSLQSKSVTIQNNGTTLVSVDSGYYGLSSVNILTNVSDGGGGTTIPIFSTTEVEVGTWIDNKPLYMKTITGTITTNSSGGFDQLSISTNISDALDLIFLGENSFFMTAEGESYPVNYLYTNSSGSTTSLVKTRPTKVDKTILTLCYGSLFPASSTITYTFNVFYVKTSDSVVSNPSTLLGNNFSTTEHLAGTDDNGINIYEKTVEITTTNYRNNVPINKTISHNISDIDKVWITNGSFMYSSGSSKRETYPVNYFNHYSSTYRQVSHVKANKTQIEVFVGDWQMNAGTIYHYITLRYTKSTA